MTKSPNKTIIFVREPDMDVPEAYLRKVLAACPSGGGYSIQSKDKDDNPELVTDNMDTGVPLSDVQDLLKSVASHRVLFAFNKLEKVKEEFLQPYHVAIDGDDVLLSFAIDGSFPTMVEAGSTEESLLAQRVMFPNIQKLIKFSAGDLDKFIGELRDPTFVDMVMARIGDRGEYCFLPPVGDAIWFGKNTLGSTFPWGRTSDTLGYTETPATAPVVEDKRKGWWGKSKGPGVPVAQETAPVVPAEPAAPPPNPAPLNIPAVQPDTKVRPPAVTPATVDPNLPPPKGHWEVVPKGLSKDQRKKLIRRVTNCGAQLPEAWNVDPFPYWVVDYPKDERLTALVEQKRSEPKDMRAAAPRPVLHAPKSGNDVDVLMMSKEERDGIETHILNVLGYNAKHITTPLEIQKQESLHPPFSQEFGLKFETLNGWTPKQLRLLGSKGLVHYALEARRRLINMSAGSPPVEVGETAPEAVAENPAAPASSSNAKKNYWGKPRAA